MAEDSQGDSTSLIARAATLAERCAPLPDEPRARTGVLLEKMRADGLLSACVPPSHGGPGLDLGSLARIGFHIARVDGSAGLIYAMHVSQALCVVRHGQGPCFDRFQREMVRDGVLIASGTSEKGPEGDILVSLAQVEETEAGLHIVKESPNISYLDAAGAVLVTANRTDERGRTRQVLALVRAADATFVPGRRAEFLGMNGMLNSSWTITARFAEDAVFAEPFAAIAHTTMVPSIHVLWAASWSGIAAAALDAARQAVAEAPDDVAPHLRLELTRLADRHWMMNAMIRDVIDDQADEARSLDLAYAARVNRLKTCGSELAVEICQGALKIVGIRGYGASGGVSVATLLADALAGPLMVSNLRLSLNNAKVERFLSETL